MKYTRGTMISLFTVIVFMYLLVHIFYYVFNVCTLYLFCLLIYVDAFLCICVYILYFIVYSSYSNCIASHGVHPHWSKTPGSDHTRVDAQNTCVPKAAAHTTYLSINGLHYTSWESDGISWKMRAQSPYTVLGPQFAWVQVSTSSGFPILCHTITNSLSHTILYTLSADNLLSVLSVYKMVWLRI